ncbi:MAG: chorismate mutase [Terracidiphilus sp.]|nr:chorismate mutase [Terracidiphilus sp.]
MEDSQQGHAYSGSALKKPYRFEANSDTLEPCSRQFAAGPAFWESYEDRMTLEDLRLRIDELDRQLVDLLSERARAAQMVGQLKVASSLPVYEPGREKIVYANVRAANKGPLPDIELTHIYERIIDVMRCLQRNELASQRNAQTAQANADSCPTGQTAGQNEPGKGI